MATEPADILAFWRAAGPDKWFNKNDAFDAEIRQRFLDTYEAAAAGRLAAAASYVSRNLCRISASNASFLLNHLSGPAARQNARMSAGSVAMVNHTIPLILRAV